MLRILLLGAVVATCASVGCESPKSATPPDGKQVLLEEAYNLLQIRAEQGKPPARKIDDIAAYENAYPTGYAAIQSGEVVVNWGAAPSPASEGILAYAKGADTAGGWVLLANGTTKQMTADEFKATPKAK